MPFSYLLLPNPPKAEWLKPTLAYRFSWFCVLAGLLLCWFHLGSLLQLNSAIPPKAGSES